MPTSISGAVAGDGVRPGAVGLLIGIECSRIRDSTLMYLTSLVTTRIGVELVLTFLSAITRNGVVKLVLGNGTRNGCWHFLTSLLGGVNS